MKNPNELQDNLSANHITKTPNTPVFSETRDKTTQESRDMKNEIASSSAAFSGEPPRNDNLVIAPNCPYCKSKDTVKRGLRKKKYETAQLFLCNSCKKAFTGQLVKGKQFPLRLILEGLSLYNIGHTLEKTCQLLKEQFGLEVKPATLSDWVKEFEDLCAYSRMRQFGMKLYSPNQVIQAVSLYHRQVHILDYKPAKTTKREQPITQLTLYALALSRLTGLRLYDFKCAWFDENAYFEFFPLHVVYKLRDKAEKEDPAQMKWDTLIDTDVEKNTKDADIARKRA